MNMNTFFLGLGLLVALTILMLIRRDRLVIMHSIWWLTMATLILILAFFPELVDLAAKKVGIAYPPSLLFVAAILVVVIKLLMSDIDRSHDRRRLLLLAQRVALLQADLSRHKDDRLGDPSEKASVRSDTGV